MIGVSSAASPTSESKMKKPNDLFYEMYCDPHDRGEPSMECWLQLRMDVLYHARSVHRRAFILYERMRRMMLVAWLVKNRLKDGDDRSIPFQSRSYWMYGSERHRAKLMRRYYWKEAA